MTIEATPGALGSNDPSGLGPERNKVVGALQLLRHKGAHHDSAGGQEDLNTAMEAVDAYCAKRVVAEREWGAALGTLGLNAPTPAAYAKALCAAWDEKWQKKLNEAVAAERERCAKLCESMDEGKVATHYDWTKQVGAVIAAAIRGV